ncbi:MAG: methyltransferase domain-containing protein [Dehalococcoidia bacterium]
MKWRPDLYDLLFRDKDYAGEAARLREIIEARNPGARTLLDVACGTGRHLEHLRRWYDVEGADASPEMLEAAAGRVPGVTLHHGDMARFRLGRRFDVITCLFSAIAHMRTVPRLRRAIANIARHLAPGGVLIVEPWDSPDGWDPDTPPWVEVVEDGPRRLVCMETSVLEPGPVWRQETHFLLFENGRIEHVREVTRVGAFTDEEQLAAFRDAGLDAEHDPRGLIGRGLYVGVRRA